MLTLPICLVDSLHQTVGILTLTCTKVRANNQIPCFFVEGQESKVVFPCSLIFPSVESTLVSVAVLLNTSRKYPKNSYIQPGNVAYILRLTVNEVYIFFFHETYASQVTQCSSAARASLAWHV